MSVLGAKLLSLHQALDVARLGHAFGGAIALAYCTRDPRGTSDLDINVFIEMAEVDRLIAALPPQIGVDQVGISQLTSTGQARLWWDDTPVDVFLNVHDFHERAEALVQRVPFEGQQIPVLSCSTLATFKVMFDRPKDWIDLQSMVDAGSANPGEIGDTVERLLGADSRVSRIRALVGGEC